MANDDVLRDDELFDRDTAFSVGDESEDRGWDRPGAKTKTPAEPRLASSELPLVQLESSEPERSLLTDDPSDLLDEAAIGSSSASLPTERLANRYVPDKILGRGGMGEVRLYHDRMIGRDIAMKIALGTSDGSRSPRRQRRFAREAKIQAQLDHPSIVPVYEVGVDPSGALYFTMKHVRGISLAAVLVGLQEGDPELTARYTRRRLLTLFSRLCVAVHFCHQKGVVHRDLKPSNIMLGSFGEVFLLDWGLALVGVTPARSAPLSVEQESGGRPDQLVGTPGYMAPEQIEHARSVDARADVYALGVMLFELLTLERLHVARPTAQALVSTLELDGASPADRAPQRDVPPELDGLCVQATRRDPAARMSSAAALSEEIEAYLDGDRDLELRRALAASHAKEADAALVRANEGQDEHEERARAMREATAALGLDANNRVALRTLMRLIAEPPRTIPEEARREFEAERRDAQRATARMGLWFYLSYLLYVPLLHWMGIRDTKLFALGWICISGCALTACWTLYRPSKHLDVPLAHVATATFTVGAASVIFGPFVLGPMLALSSGVMYLSAFDDRRGLVPLASCLAVVAPAVLAWLGVIPDAYLFEEGRWTILPSVFHISPLPTQVFMTLAIVGTIIPACMVVARLRRQYSETHAKLQLHAWQLRRMVPEEAQQDAGSSALNAD
jgi:serine/threonine-protein kinase